MPLVRAHLASPIGPLVLDVSDDGVRALSFDPSTWPESDPVPPTAGEVVDVDAHGVLAEAATQLEEWFAGARTRFDLPLDLQVRGFARQVLTAMSEIPPGQVRSYGELATSMGRDAGSARAVGRACTSNPVPIIVPCHRVIASDGTLGGYAGGLALKRWLLGHEGHDAAVPPGGWQTRRGRDRTADEAPRLF